MSVSCRRSLCLNSSYLQQISVLSAEMTRSVIGEKIGTTIGIFESGNVYQTFRDGTAVPGGSGRQAGVSGSRSRATVCGAWQCATSNIASCCHRTPSADEQLLLQYSVMSYQSAAGVQAGPAGEGARATVPGCGASCHLRIVAGVASYALP